VALNDATAKHYWQVKDQHSDDELAMAETHTKTYCHRHYKAYPSVRDQVVPWDFKFSGAIRAAKR